MMQAVRLYAVTLLFSAAAVQCSQGKRTVKVTNETKEERFIALYKNKERQDYAYTNAPGVSKHAYLDLPSEGKVTILVSEYKPGKQEGYAMPSFTKKEIEVSDLIGKQVLVGKNPNGDVLIDISRWADAPDKQWIRRTFKTTEDKVEWTVLITDQNDKEITKKTLKQNTGNLDLQLNTYEITKTDDPNIVYNANKIKVFRGKDTSGKPLFEPKIVKWNEVDSQKPELEISATGVNFVKKGSEKESKTFDKKIRAYKTVEEKADWTVVVIDNKDTEITKKTFKQNTSDLYLHLNFHETTQPDDPNIRYNANKIKVFKGKDTSGKPLFEKVITAKEWDPKKSELEISATGANFVEKGTEKASKVSDLKIRAYKTVERQADWTVVITDSSDNPVSKSTFRQNTDGLTTNALKLRLNSTEITQGSEGQKRYNANNVKVFKRKQAAGAPSFTKTITVKDVNSVPNGELQITADDVTVVVSGSEPK